MLEAPDNGSRTTKHQRPTNQTKGLDRASLPTRRTGKLDQASRPTRQMGELDRTSRPTRLFAELDRTRRLHPILIAPSSVIGSNRLLFRLDRSHHQNFTA